MFVSAIDLFDKDLTKKEDVLCRRTAKRDSQSIREPHSYLVSSGNRSPSCVEQAAKSAHYVPKVGSHLSPPFDATTSAESGHVQLVELWSERERRASRIARDALSHCFERFGP